jgi:defect in organelle trafficking protein DotC
MQKLRLQPTISCLLILCLALCCAACSSNAPKDFYRVADAKTSTPSGINNIRYVAIKQTSRGLGAQAGLAWRSQQINRLLERDKNKLSQIFNFSYLILNNDVLPPVLTEGRNTLNLADDQNIRISDRDYQIVYPPRFITAPPTWRDYIWMNYKKPEIPNATLLPKNHREAIVWNQFIKIGWNEGIEQADEIFTANINRLVRDFSGMVLYRKLLAQNMISAPYVAEADLGITGGGNDLHVNDRVLRITSTSELLPNSKVWRPVLAPKKMLKSQQQISPELADYYKSKDKI